MCVPRSSLFKCHVVPSGVAYFPFDEESMGWGYAIVISRTFLSGSVEFGLSTCICLEMPMQKALSLLSEHGIARVECAAFNLIMSSTDRRLRYDYISTRDAWALRREAIPTEEISGTASSLGISLEQVHSPDFEIGSPDTGGRALAVNKVVEMLGICRDLGAPRLILHPGPLRAAALNQATIAEGLKERTIASIGALARWASDLGVKIALENGWQDAYGSRAEDLTEMVESTDPDHICACLDTGHSQRLGVPPDVMLRSIGSHLAATHVHDSIEAQDHLPPFEGEIDWNGFASTLRGVGYRGTLMGEIQGSTDPPTCVRWMLRSKQAMAKLAKLVDPTSRSPEEIKNSP